MPATSEIARLPSSDDDTALIESSTTGRQRVSVAGGAKPNSQSVIVGRSISRNSARNVSVTSDSTEPNTPPAKPEQRARRVGQPLRRAPCSALRTLSSAPAGDDDAPGTPACCESSSQYAGQLVDELDDLVPHRPGRDEHEREHRDEQRGEHDERRPAATPAAAHERADHRVEAERDHRARGRSRAACRATRCASADEQRRSTNSSSSVRVGMTISTRCARLPWRPALLAGRAGERSSPGGLQRLGEARLGLVVERRLDHVARDLDVRSTLSASPGARAR